MSNKSSSAPATDVTEAQPSVEDISAMLAKLSPEARRNLGLEAQGTAEVEIKAKDDAFDAKLQKFIQDKAPHALSDGIEVSDEDPRSYLLVMKGEGVISVIRTVHAAPKTRAPRAFAAEKEWADYGFEGKDRLVRGVVTPTMALKSGFPMEASFSIEFRQGSAGLEAFTKNADGDEMSGSPTKTGRHAAGARDTDKQHQPSLNGVKFWLDHKTSHVLRGDRVLRIVDRKVVDPEQQAA